MFRKLFKENVSRLTQDLRRKWEESDNPLKKASSVFQFVPFFRLFGNVCVLAVSSQLRLKSCVCVVSMCFPFFLLFLSFTKSVKSTAGLQAGVGSSQKFRQKRRKKMSVVALLQNVASPSLLKRKARFRYL